MGKILKFRHRGPLPEVKARLAYLSEELTLTAGFADAMIREGNYRAAVGVIDEQRSRLSQAEQHVVRAFALPSTRRRRSHAAIAGLAAVLVIGSASFAALGLHSRPSTPKSPRVIQQAEQSLTEAQQEGSTATINEAVIKLDAIGDAIAKPTTPDFDTQVHNFLNHQLDIFDKQGARTNSHMQLLLKKIQELRDKVDKKIEEPKPAPKPEPKPDAQPPAASTPSTP